MTALLGDDVNTWLVIGLLVLTLGLTGALMAATRNVMPGPRRTR
jgi:hypothetical protein